MCWGKCSTEEGKAAGDPDSMRKYLMVEYEHHRLCSLVPRGQDKRQESNDSVRVVKHWHRLPKEMMESPSLELSKPQLDPVPASSCS